MHVIAQARNAAEAAQAAAAQLAIAYRLFLIDLRAERRARRLAQRRTANA